MDNNTFVQTLLSKMESVRPGPIRAEDVLTPEFFEKHTKFKNFQEMVQLATKESGLIEQYAKRLKDALTGGGETSPNPK